MQLKLLKRSGEAVEVEAYQTTVPELVYHQPISKHDPSGWHVTHKRSGLKVSWWPLATQAQALQVASRLAGLDWDFDFDTAPRGAALEPYRLAYQSALDAEAGRAQNLPNVKESRGLANGW